MTELLPVTVKRATWYRGHGPDGSQLRRVVDRHQCCLGFAACAIGFAPSTLIEVPNFWMLRAVRPSPLALSHEVAQRLNAETRVPQTAQFGREPRNVQHLLIMINDDRRLADDEREAMLTRYGEFAGIAFTFED